MKKTSTWLLNFKSDKYSQMGEDGIIEKILKILPKKDKWCVEFGAWDGKYLSNTRNLIENKNYAAILIEGSKTKFKELEKNYSKNSKVISLNQFVGFEKKDNLDQILAKTSIPVDFDFLSIDIDGNDYHVWKAMSKYKPKVVCIEFNPTIPTEVKFVQKADNSVNQGSSLLSLVELGKEKGYELVAVLSVNAFFVKSEYYPLFQIENNSPEVLRTNSDFVTYLFSGYDGQIFLQGLKKLPWHGLELCEEKMQSLPKFLRKYPCNYNLVEKMLAAVFLLLASPGLFFGKLFSRLKVAKL